MGKRGHLITVGLYLIIDFRLTHQLQRTGFACSEIRKQDPCFPAKIQVQTRRNYKTHGDQEKGDKNVRSK